MLANEKLDQTDDGTTLPITARTDAEVSAERKWGPDWRSKRLDAHFAVLIEPENTAEAIKPEASVVFPWWNVMLLAPNREEKAAKRFERLKIPIYWPAFGKKMRCRGKSHALRLCAVMPGLLFAPREIMAIDDRDAVLKWAGVSNFIRDGDGHPALMSKSDIDIIRNIEAKLNLPPEAKGVLFKIGERVRFKDDVYAEFWGDGSIFEIASEARIGLLVEKLFGRTTKVYVAASEIEAK